MVILLGTANAQHFTNSPYSYFGLGEINHVTTGQATAMGGVTSSSRFGGNINFNNPASYTALNNQSYIFNVGVTAKQSMFTYKDATATQNNSNLNYMTAGFRATKFWAASFGLVPFSSVGYLIEKSFIDELTEAKYDQAYVGSGGLNRVYFGNSFKLHKYVSVGVNGSYLFGSLNKSINSLMTNGNFSSYTEIKEELKLSGFRFDYGIQTQYKVKETTIGISATYESNSQLKSYGTEYIVSTMRNSNIANNDTLYSADGIDDKKTSEVPDKVSVGIFLNFSNKVTINADYSVQDWTNSLYMNGTLDYYAKAERISAGLEYVPNIASFKYHQAIRYRLGASRKTGYQIVPVSNGNTSQPVTYAVTYGMGFPLKGSPTFLNIAFEVGNTETPNGGISENFFILHADFALRDIWFIKRKYN